MQLFSYPDTSLGKKFALVILLLVLTFGKSVNAERTCHQCNDINCLRTSYKVTQICLNDLDVCVTVFNGQTVLAQGCLEQLSEDLRLKCQAKYNDNLQSLGSEDLSECFMCNTNLCNNLASSSFKCIQCDSDNDENCRSNPESLEPLRCDISRTPNEYCFVKLEGERVIRGCSKTLEDQQSCLSSSECMICQPSEIKACNGLTKIPNDNNGSGEEGNGETGNGGGSDGENSSNGDTGTSVDNASKRICHQCNGINCLRSSYHANQECLNNLDICVSVFEGQTILAQGCLEQLPSELRNKCDDGNEDYSELSECVKCNENLCNNMASKSYECIQCDSQNDDNCRNNPSSFIPSRCFISRTLNEYCFIKKDNERVIRGCSYTLEEQQSCLASADCMICQPSVLNGCNGLSIENDNGSGDNGSSSGSGGGGSGDGGSDSGSDGKNPTDGGSESGSGESGSGGENPSDGGSESGSGDSGSDSSSENKPNDGNSGSGDGGNGSEDGNTGNTGSHDGAITVVNSQVLIFITNIIIVVFITN